MIDISYDFELGSHMLLSLVYYEGKVIYDGYMKSFFMTYIFTCCTKEMHDKLKFVQLKISHMTQKKKKKKKGQIMQDKEKSYLYISLLHIFYMYC